MKSEDGSRLLAIMIGVAAYQMASVLIDTFPVLSFFQKVSIDSRMVFIPSLLILAIAFYKLLMTGIKKIRKIHTTRNDRTLYLIGTGCLCLYLTSCVAVTPIPNPFPSLPGKIVYSVDYGRLPYRTDIYVMNPDGTDRIKLTNNGGRNEEPAWSPDGQQIVFSSESTGYDQAKLYIMNADGRGLHVLEGSHTYANNPAWSPNGKEIAYITGAGSKIRFISTNGTPPQSSFPVFENLEQPRVFLCYSPDWSPDGKYLTAACQTFNEEDKREHIYKFKADGSSFECLTCGSPLDIDFFDDARWSPDGLYIGVVEASLVSNTAFSTIYIMSPDGKDQKPLITTQIYGRVADWAWSPDGQWIVAISYANPALRFYKVDGTQFYQIEDLPGVPISVDWGQ
ncbi:MAG: TolB family protein [Chloroflexota bacterium]